MPQISFELLETLLWDAGFALQPYHLDRMQQSAAFFGWPFERSMADALLQAKSGSFDSAERHVVRLMLDATGQLRLEVTALVPLNVHGRVCLAEERSNSDDVFLQHRTTQRERYDRLYDQARAHNFDDVIFLNERGEVTEGAVHSVFVEKAGKLLTSPVRCGLLPGVYRRHLLETRPEAEERVLTLEDLKQADKIFLTDSVHGLVQTRIDGLQD